jgi:glycosyltransferase involved in cell wall biosynthesis
MATLDVLIPHYNDADALAMSLETVERQTWGGDLKVIVVDDGSVKKSLKAAEGAICNSPLDIDLVKSPENCGRPVTRNKLLEASDAPFVAWLDAGDTWYPEKTQAQFDTIYRMSAEGLDIDTHWVTCNYDWKWEGKRRRKVYQSTDGDQLRDLFVGDRLRAYLWTLLGTRKSFDLTSRFDERLLRLQDLDYFISFVRAGGRLVSPDHSGALCCYFKSDVGRNAQEIRGCYDTIFHKHAPSFSSFGPQFVRRAKAKADLVAARFAKNNHERARTLGYQLSAIKTDPRFAAFRAKKSLSKG